MKEESRSAVYVYLLCTTAAVIAFGCRTLLPKPEPGQPNLTSKPGDVFPTDAISTESSPIDEPGPLATKQPDNTEVTVTREQKFYQITDSTEKELRQQLNKLDPLDEETGKIFDARTDWVIKWDFYYNKGG